MLMTVYILLNHFTAAGGEVSMCTLIHICIYVKWIIWQFLVCWVNGCAEWDGEQDWPRGKASPAHESASVMVLVQSMISLGCAAEVESILICSGQMHKAVVPLHPPAGRAPACSVLLSTEVHRSLTVRGEGFTITQLCFSFAGRVWFSLVPREKITLRWIFV